MRSRYGTKQDYQRLANNLVDAGEVINNAIMYTGTSKRVRIGDLVIFPSRDNFPIMDTGAVIGAGYCGWEPVDHSNPPNVSVVVVLLDESMLDIPIERIQKICLT